MTLELSEQHWRDQTSGDGERGGGDGQVLFIELLNNLFCCNDAGNTKTLNYIMILTLIKI